MTKEKLRQLKDGTYRWICHEDNLDESFDTREAFIDALIKGDKHYNLHDANKNELLKSFDNGWLALDNWQVVSEVQSTIFEDEQNAISDRQHERSESLSVRTV